MKHKMDCAANLGSQCECGLDKQEEKWYTINLSEEEWYALFRAMEDRVELYHFPEDAFLLDRLINLKGST
jgi:hypothetical protein